MTCDARWLNAAQFACCIIPNDFTISMQPFCLPYICHLKSCTYNNAASIPRLFNRLIEHCSAAASRQGFTLSAQKLGSSSLQPGGEVTGRPASAAGEATGLERLPEDEELRGFEPLTGGDAHAALPAASGGAAGEAVARARRLLAQAR